MSENLTTEGHPRRDDARRADHLPRALGRDAGVTLSAFLTLLMKPLPASLVLHAGLAIVLLTTREFLVEEVRAPRISWEVVELATLEPPVEESPPPRQEPREDAEPEAPTETWRPRPIPLKPATRPKLERAPLPRVEPLPHPEQIRPRRRPLPEPSPEPAVTPVVTEKDESVAVPVARLISARRSHAPPPRYPERARERGFEGRVVLEVDLDEEGRVVEVRVLSSSGHSLLDRAARRALLRWRFEPARRGDRREPSTTRVAIDFRLT